MDELIRQGDLKMAALVAAADAADRAFTKVREADEGEAKTTDDESPLKTQHAVTE